MQVLLLQEVITYLQYDQSDSALQWYLDSSIKLDDSQSITLNKEQRYQLLKVVFRSTNFDLDYKQQLLEKEKAIDFSDLDVLEE